MRVYNERKLHAKINRIVIGILVVVFAMMGFLIFDMMNQLTKEETAIRGYEIGNYIGVLSSEEILQDNQYLVFTRIKKTCDMNRDVRYIIVTDYRGHVFTSTINRQFPEGLPKAINVPAEKESLTTYYNSNEGIITEIIVPIEGGKVGAVRVGMKSDTMDLLMLHMMVNFILFIALLLILAGFFGNTLTAQLIRPIEYLAAASLEVTKNNYNVQVPVLSEDEVGRMTEAFNEMVRELKAKNEAEAYLIAELQKKEDNRNMLLRKLYTMQEDTRKALSRELHDGAGQSITSILAYLRILYSQTNDPKQQQLIDAARDIVAGVLNEMRQMALDLRPPSIDDIGVIQAMEKYFYRTIEHNELSGSFSAEEGIPRLSDEISLALYRILQEAMTNIIRHANATTVEVTIQYQHKTLFFSIRDNGCGFSEEEAEFARRNDHIGLYGMKERIEILKGLFKINSAQNQGTTILISIPLEEAEDEN